MAVLTQHKYMVHFFLPTLSLSSSPCPQALHVHKTHTSKGLGGHGFRTENLLIRFCDIYPIVEQFAIPLLKHIKICDNIWKVNNARMLSRLES